MNPALAGAAIRRERLRRDWSQEGLCRGLCSVSYLSKIENGAAGADAQLIAALLGRLGLSAEAEPADAALIERSYEAFFALDSAKGAACLSALEEAMPRLERTLLAADAELLEIVLSDGGRPAPDWPERSLGLRQRSLMLLLRGEPGEAWRLSGEPVFALIAGDAEFNRGDYISAADSFGSACRAAAELGRVRVMLSARLMMGNCCSNSGQYEGMERHYRIAERIAADLGDAGALRTIRYNRASTAIELGRAEEGYAYFSALPEPTAMELHKLAAACELLGKREEALAALDRVSAAPRGGSAVENAVVDEMCAMLRWRLEQPDYLSSAEYGRRLLALFQRLRGELPPGYAGFHLGRVLEWLRANRQYKRALDILKDFPGYYS